MIWASAYRFLFWGEGVERFIHRSSDLLCANLAECGTHDHDTCITQWQMCRNAVGTNWKYGEENWMTTWEVRMRAICGNWVKTKLNDTRSKKYGLESATPSPSVSTRNDQHWFEIRDEKKKKRKKETRWTPRMPHPRWFSSWFEIYDFASLASLCYTGLWVPQVLYLCSSDLSEHLCWFCGPLSPSISLLSISGSRVVTPHNMTALAFPSARTSTSPQLGT